MARKPEKQKNRGKGSKVIDNPDTPYSMQKQSLGRCGSAPDYLKKTKQDEYQGDCIPWHSGDNVELFCKIAGKKEGKIETKL